ncbi:JDVT-CTERM domain-containing protein, partial [Bathymodiolus thermophilus thioautotrophic gill symbiont]|uniref:JDVT-CTERM domain-containing protein n=1 Tax=Bathymodiolus thermophilus thioautotrophic gill symbiont TaxID=2360 RepID=UPI001300DA8C
PVIRRFTISQGVNQGRLIIKTDTSVTVYAEASGGSSYTWSSSDFSVIGSGAFVTFIPNADVGTRTIKLKVTIGDYSSERVLKLKLVESHPTDWKDKNNNGINDSKEIGHHNNELLVGENKKITSPINTRLLLGIMSEDTAHLTLAQMKKYRTDNNLSDNTEDTLTTGDIYDYVVENFSATTQVIIELTSPIPANAILRKYSPATGWANFVINDNNIQSKTSNTCTDDTHWQTGLTTGATCLKLTIKDGSENDTDGDQNNGKGQVNGVVESTISIAIPAASNNNNNSGGGCVYNPNAPARFDMGFILLMTLSAYYLIRRRR